MLGIYEYIALTDNQRAEKLWADGEFITNVLENGQAFSLYALYGYYVEITLIDNQITEISPFKLGHRLEKYLPYINLSER